MTSEIERFQKSEVEERGECLPKALALLSGGCVKTTRKGSRYFHGRAFINRREHARPHSCGENFLRPQVIRTILPIISFCVVNINMNLGGYYCYEYPIEQGSNPRSLSCRD